MPRSKQLHLQMYYNNIICDHVYIRTLSKNLFPVLWQKVSLFVTMFLVLLEPPLHFGASWVTTFTFFANEESDEHCPWLVKYKKL